MSTPAKVTFTSRGYKLAGHFYPPVVNSPNRSGAAVVIAHPWTSIKEHSPAHYARVLSQAGFYCLAYDAAYQGESEGEPRYLEDPGQRVEDIKSAVTYLVSRNETDSGKIGVLGICASGGYVSFAAQTDLRIKAVSISAGVCSGTMARQGLDKDGSNLAVLHTQLEAAARDRNSDVTGEKVDIIHMLPDEFDPATASADMPESFRDLASYYCTARATAAHPRNPNICLPRSWDIMGNFDAFAWNQLISPRPFLAITGTKAASKWYSEDAVAKAKEPKELFVVDGLTHADLYDNVEVAGAKLNEFFGKYLV
ncbi:Alpha/Beta hydrolase protein [Colletotrichum godetiae]|uniref:Alpha/Beta hydrolase protein n=1 Tax=Colletotrichum godetiae TaxID=1209918 RepID=A0AAJ0AFS8_9PEZI|nr:Alpha/Beta hydrolase protein [Colletotrichum godetiae]KAK1660115.1 Alpha/Beta hydrolase protein [Colletotrichum godetiae]